tara:strand:+ start:1848 stop:2408 length:561 start_codon:yes stop_codon:yes gene_type:complete
MQTYDKLEKAYIGGSITQTEMRQTNIGWARQIEMSQAAIDGPEFVKAKTIEWREYDNPPIYEIGQMITMHYSMRCNPWNYDIEGTMGLGMVIDVQPKDRTITVYWNVPPWYPKESWDAAELHRTTVFNNKMRNHQSRKAKVRTYVPRPYIPRGSEFVGYQQVCTVLRNTLNVGNYIMPWIPLLPKD